ncbi:MAG: hypothetical protein O9327_04880 [Polaromonas sp.]|nr:hypothetical protein [Polaromonas sp.]
MDPMVIPLAFGCILTFSQIDKALTEAEGQALDGAVYRTATLSNANGRKHLLEPAAHGQGLSPGPLFRAGRSPDGLFASYMVFSQGASRNTGDVRFVSAKACAPVRFVRVRDGSTVDAASYRGWHKDSPHAVRVWEGGKLDSLGLPIDEAKAVNPAINELQ